MTQQEYEKVVKIIEDNFETLWVSGEYAKKGMTQKGLDRTKLELRRLVKWENTKK